MDQDSEETVYMVNKRHHHSHHHQLSSSSPNLFLVVNPQNHQQPIVREQEEGKQGISGPSSLNNHHHHHHHHHNPKIPPSIASFVFPSSSSTSSSKLLYSSSPLLLKNQTQSSSSTIKTFNSLNLPSSPTTTTITTTTTHSHPLFDSLVHPSPLTPANHYPTPPLTTNPIPFPIIASDPKPIINNNDPSLHRPPPPPLFPHLSNPQLGYFDLNPPPRPPIIAPSFLELDIQYNQFKSVLSAADPQEHLQKPYPIPPLLTAESLDAYSPSTSAINSAASVCSPFPSINYPPLPLNIIPTRLNESNKRPGESILTPESRPKTKRKSSSISTSTSNTRSSITSEDSPTTQNSRRASLILTPSEIYHQSNNPGPSSFPYPNASLTKVVGPPVSTSSPNFTPFSPTIALPTPSSLGPGLSTITTSSTRAISAPENTSFPPSAVGSDEANPTSSHHAPHQLDLAHLSNIMSSLPTIPCIPSPSITPPTDAFLPPPASHPTTATATTSTNLIEEDGLTSSSPPWKKKQVASNAEDLSSHHHYLQQPHQIQVHRVPSPPVNKQMGAASAGVSEELAATLEPIFTSWLGRLCSDLDMKDSKGESIHQTLMARKMQRLEESTDFRPFKFRIQAFTNAFFEELIRCGFSEKELPMKKVRQYLWSQTCIARFNEEGKKSKSKGNHVWHIEAQKIVNGQWNFLHFQRKIAANPNPLAYATHNFVWAPKVWDPQRSAHNIKAHFTTASNTSLPGWLSWKNHILLGTPAVEDVGKTFEFGVVATMNDNSGPYNLDLNVKVTVRPASEYAVAAAAAAAAASALASRNGGSAATFNAATTAAASASTCFSTTVATAAAGGFDSRPCPISFDPLLPAASTSFDAQHSASPSYVDQPSFPGSLRQDQRPHLVTNPHNPPVLYTAIEHEARLQNIRDNLMSSDVMVSDHAGRLVRDAIVSKNPIDREFAAQVLGPMDGPAAAATTTMTSTMTTTTTTTTTKKGSVGTEAAALDLVVGFGKQDLS